MAVRGDSLAHDGRSPRSDRTKGREPALDLTSLLGFARRAQKPPKISSRASYSTGEPAEEQEEDRDIERDEVYAEEAGFERLEELLILFDLRREAGIVYAGV